MLRLRRLQSVRSLSAFLRSKERLLPYAENAEAKILQEAVAVSKRRQKRERERESLPLTLTKERETVLLLLLLYATQEVACSMSVGAFVVGSCRTSSLACFHQSQWSRTYRSAQVCLVLLWLLVVHLVGFGLGKDIPEGYSVSRFCDHCLCWYYIQFVSP